MALNVNLKTLRYFAVQPFEKCTLEDLQSLVEQLKSFVALSRQQETQQTETQQTETQQTETQQTPEAHHSSNVQTVTKNDSIYRIAEVGVNLLTEEIRIRQLPRTKSWQQ